MSEEEKSYIKFGRALLSPSIHSKIIVPPKNVTFTQSDWSAVFSTVMQPPPTTTPICGSNEAGGLLAAPAPLGQERPSSDLVLYFAVARSSFHPERR